ncbi:hypothetical protein GOP47_0024009 [Adiantum capillus-veneris]|uniref:Uncharacterized protein n=1 Tax=Adiantum capillus-veneris TaxID=13818 RepID=A0A9D4U4M2_ADICA|nr:hypothetical protein GOP47_0024009 [Adiantum capillus-veneris]
MEAKKVAEDRNAETENQMAIIRKVHQVAMENQRWMQAQLDELLMQSLLAPQPSAQPTQSIEGQEMLRELEALKKEVAELKEQRELMTATTAQASRTDFEEMPEMEQTEAMDTQEPTQIEEPMAEEPSGEMAAETEDNELLRTMQQKVEEEQEPTIKAYKKWEYEVVSVAVKQYKNAQ